MLNILLTASVPAYSLTYHQKMFLSNSLRGVMVLGIMATMLLQEANPEPHIFGPGKVLPSSAKPQLQLQLCLLAELTLISVNPATPPHPPPPPPPGKVYLVAVAN